MLLSETVESDSRPTDQRDSLVPVNKAPNRQRRRHHKPPLTSAFSTPEREREAVYERPWPPRSKRPTDQAGRQAASERGLVTERKMSLMFVEIRPEQPVLRAHPETSYS